MGQPQDLLAQTRRLLAELYLDPGMARIIAQDAGLDMRQVEYSNRPLENWQAILEEAQKQGQVLAVLDIASQQYSQNPDLRRLRIAWATQVQPVSDEQPSVRVAPVASARQLPGRSRPLWLIGIVVFAALVVVIFIVSRELPSASPDSDAPTSGAAVERTSATDIAQMSASTREAILQPQSTDQPGLEATPLRATSTVAVSDSSSADQLGSSIVRDSPTPVRGEITNPFNTLAWSPDGKFLAGGDMQETITILDANSITVVRTIEAQSRVNSIYWSPDSSQLVSGSYDHDLRIWRASDGALLRTLVGHTGSVESVAWSSNGQWLASGADDATVRIWDSKSDDALLRTLEGLEDWVMSVAWSPDNRLLASASGKTVRIWDPTSPTPLLLTLKDDFEKEGDFYHGVNSLAWSPDSSLLASGSDEGIIRIWDVVTGTLVRRMDGHTWTIKSVIWSPDGSQIASGSGDRMVRIWDASSGAELRAMEANPVQALAWSPDSQKVAVATNDQTIRIWQIK